MAGLAMLAGKNIDFLGGDVAAPVMRHQGSLEDMAFPDTARTDQAFPTSDVTGEPFVMPHVSFMQRSTKDANKPSQDVGSDVLSQFMEAGKHPWMNDFVSASIRTPAPALLEKQADEPIAAPLEQALGDNEEDVQLTESRSQAVEASSDADAVADPDVDSAVDHEYLAADSIARSAEMGSHQQATADQATDFQADREQDWAMANTEAAKADADAQDALSLIQSLPSR